MIDKLTTNYSPNFTPFRRNSKNIKFIILHYTGMSSEILAIKRLTDVKSKVSCHFFIKNNGKIILMVPEKYIAWHAGISKWKNYNSLNKNSIGIEIQNPGHKHNFPKFKNKQIKSLIKLCLYLKKKYKISKENILGHSDISYKRKKDPGGNFPWSLLSKNKLSIWCDFRNKVLENTRNVKISKIDKKNFFYNLKEIGYEGPSTQKEKKLLILAFQMKFRSQLINGILDKECLLISSKLRKI